MSKGRQQPPNIPTDEEFARASESMSAQHRMFATIRDHVLRLFAAQAQLHDIYFFGSETDYEAHIFYDSEADIERCRVNGVERMLKEAICQAFAGTAKSQGSSISPTLAFKFDSHENVKRRCNGNYDKYFR